MKIIIKMIAAIVLLAISGLTMADLSTSPLVPQEEANFAKDYLQKLRERSFNHVKLYLDPAIATQATDQKLEDVAHYFPSGKLISTELIGSQTNTFNTTWQGNFSFEYQFEDGWAVANVVIKRADKKLTVVGFNVSRTEASQRVLNKFSIYGKSLWHYVILTLAIATPLFILITLIFCVRTPIPRKKWLWILFILGGIGTVSINWTSGTLDFKIFQFLLLGGSAMASSEYAPWVISAGFPLGAIMFWFKRRKFIAEKLPQQA